MLKRVRMRQKHAGTHKPLFPMGGEGDAEDDAEDAAYGAYVSGVDLLRQQVALPLNPKLLTLNTQQPKTRHPQL